MQRNAQPVLQPVEKAHFSLGGELGRRLVAVTGQWILPAPLANPGLLEMFRNRDRLPYTDQMPWAGEFAGKYLTHATQIYRLTRDENLRQHLEWFVGELVQLQGDDGYLGPWPARQRSMWPGEPPAFAPKVWDTWGHYHVILGLVLWHDATADESSLACARRIADMLCRVFLDGTHRLHELDAHEMNLAPIHALCLLHQRTGEARYLALAREIEKDFEKPPAGDYVRTALDGVEFWNTPKPRWESLHPIQGIAELYFLTGDGKYRRAFEHLWWSMLKGDRHNNGGFTSGEQATGDPYHGGAIETCCTIAWMAMSVDMLRMTGNPIVADELELSLLNSGFGLISPSGRWVTYNTPMTGRREASAHTIVFQARSGTPELNCCSVNGPRALGITCEWAVMQRADGLALNYYGPGTMSAPVSSGNLVALTQQTDYPRTPVVELRVEPQRAERFTLALRIPHWSEKTSVAVNGAPVAPVAPGRYLELAREWNRGDRVTIRFDFRPHFWVHKPWRGYTDWVTEWRVFGAFSNKASIVPPATMPESLSVEGETLPPVACRSDFGIISFEHLFGKGGPRYSALCLTEVDSATDATLAIHFSADWCAACFVNGDTIYDNHDRGGNKADRHLRTHELNIPLRAGRNLIGFRITSGTMGWRLTLGKAADAPNSNLFRASIYRGPILLACDTRFHSMSAEEVPVLDASKLDLRAVEPTTWLKPWMLFETTAVDGRSARLCDFASAGADGGVYHSWLPVRFASQPMNGFSRENPLRSVRDKE